MSLRVEQVAAPLVVLADYAALSWFPSVATATGHPEATFRVGTVFFVGLNAGVLLLGHRALPERVLRAPVVAAAARPRVSGPAWWAVFAALAAAGIGYRLWALLLLVYAFAYVRLRDASSCVRCLALTLLVVTVSVPTPFRYEFFPIIVLVTALPLLARPRTRGHGQASAP